ncbi:MAG TPA: PilN domain-containing protein [Terriglobia bacterium]|nr:PilN domain-containing protein [Terriglobia bacterium]
MMKINLLGHDLPESRLAAGPSESARQTLVFVVALAVSMSTVGFVYYYWSHQITEAQAALGREQVRQKELGSVRAQNQEYQRQLKTLEERIQTIQKLQARRQGPVDLMEGLGDSVNQTRDLYLLQVAPEGSMLHIRGEAGRVAAIAQFIRALASSPRFTEVKLKQYYQDNQNGRVNFKFNLDCSYVPPGSADQTAAGKPTLAALPPGNGR